MGGVLREVDPKGDFERIVLPLLPSAYNLARWLTRNDHDADDVVQEAFLRAYRFFPSLRSADARAWLLSIVRNTCWTWLRVNRAREVAATIDDDAEPVDGAASAEEDLVRRADGARLARALEELPAEFREVIVLRELEEMSYREIADVAGIPMGTVMSRLARARRRLQAALARPVASGAGP
ncbi:MAG: sigma-70 family RNA polymerase sigma factor [Thermoanaerobaculia bacterium]|jgi:RNA polymerase sigma-70 factor (ECF subfamily)